MAVLQLVDHPPWEVVTAVVVKAATAVAVQCDHPDPWVVVAAAAVTGQLPMAVAAAAVVVVAEVDVVEEEVTKKFHLRLTMIVLKPILLYNTILCWKYTNLL